MIAHNCRNVDGECFRLREEMMQLQSTMMQMKHQTQLRKLKKLCKSTMTEPLDETILRDSSSLTDSATQADLTSPPQQKPQMRDAQVSPLHPWTSSPSSGLKRDILAECSPIHHSSAANPSRYCHTRSHKKLHSRAHSDGEITIYKRRAQNALERVQDLSRSFQKESPSTTDNLSTKEDIEATTFNSEAMEVDTVPTAQCSVAVCMKQDDTQLPAQPKVKICRCKSPHIQKPLDSSTSEGVKASKKSSHGTGPHRCVFQQQTKSLQKRLKTLTRQVKDIAAYAHVRTHLIDEQSTLVFFYHFRSRFSMLPSMPFLKV